MAVEEVTIRVKVEDAGVEQTVSGIKSKLSGIGSGLGKVMGGVGGVMKTALGVAGGMAITGLVSGITQGIGDMITKGVQVKQVSGTFDNLTASIGETSDGMLRGLRGATRGMISDFDLMEQSNKMMSMGLATSTEEAGQLAEMGSQLAMAMGKDATAGMEEFSIMLANQSIPRLDTFGISSAAVRDRMKELQEETKGMSREQAFMQAVMEEGSVAMERVGVQGEGAAGSFARFGAQMDNIKNSLGSAVVTGLAPFAETLGGLLTEHGPKIQEVFGQLGDKLGELATEHLPGLVEGFSNWLSTISVEDIQNFASGVGDAFAKIGDVFSGDAFAGHKADIEAIKAQWDGLKATVEGALTGIGPAIQGAFAGIGAAVSGAFAGIVTSVSGAMASLGASISAAWAGITAAVSAAMSAIGATISAGWAAVTSAVSSAMSAVQSAATSAWSAIQSAVSSAMNAVRSVVTSVSNTVRSVLTSAFNAARSAVTSAANSIRSVVTSAMNAVRSAISTATSIVRGLGSAFSGVASTIQGAVGRIRAAAQNVQSALSGIKLPSFLQRQSPSPLEQTLSGINVLLTQIARRSGPEFANSMQGLGGGGATTNNNLTLVVNTNASTEPILADFALLQSLAG